MGRIFGTDGVRGLVNEGVFPSYMGPGLTPEEALKLGLAVGSILEPGSKALIGRDVRYGGDMFVSALAAGLMSSGIKPFYAGLAPTPAIQYAVRELGYDIGFMVTASHNPPEYNGIKVIDADGIELSKEKEREVKKIWLYVKNASNLLSLHRRRYSKSP